MASSFYRMTSRRLGSTYTTTATSSWQTISKTRAFSTTQRCLAASNFPMPAMSPTMTEGTISSWKVKEGDAFSAGDVLLEIETDKAQMDVEAQEDGVLMKIFIQGGKDAIPVGKRIAVLAEAGDDIKTLEIPADDSPAENTKTASPEPPKDSKSPQQPTTETKESKSSETKRAESTHGKEAAEGQKGEQPKEAKESFVNAVKEDETTGSRRKNPFIASPGIEHLLHTRKLKMEEVKGTGPGGRVLKGDVLAYLGEIGKDKPKAIAKSIDKLAHLDLSNIKVKKVEKKAAPNEEVKKELPKEVELMVQVDLNAVFATQRKLKDTINLSLPLSSFITRATQLANRNLPKSQLPPTQDDLFNQILSLPTSSSPSYTPKIQSLVPPPPPTLASAADIFDELLGTSMKPKSKSKSVSAAIPVNVFSLKVKREDEARATVFLGRVKNELEERPESLIV